jgi:hypothetical protein
MTGVGQKTLLVKASDGPRLARSLSLELVVLVPDDGISVAVRLVSNSVATGLVFRSDSKPTPDSKENEVAIEARKRTMDPTIFLERFIG